MSFYCFDSSRASLFKRESNFIAAAYRKPRLFSWLFDDTQIIRLNSNNLKTLSYLPIFIFRFKEE